MKTKSSIKRIYLNKAQEKVALIKPWSYYGILARGTGKSTRILSIRSLDAVYTMPGSCLCFFGNSYLNLGTNLVPKIIQGWKELGYVEDWDFVVGKPPPPHFKPLLSPSPDSWKHTVVFANGTIFWLGSGDRLQNILSHSFQHFIGDEARLIDFNKVAHQAFPAIRGERIKFGNSPLYSGFSFTSDMPDAEFGDWLLSKEDVMDVEQIEIILLLAIEESRQIARLIDHKFADKKSQIIKRLKIIQGQLNEMRHKSVFFDLASSLVNIDALGYDYIENMEDILTPGMFLQSILSILNTDVEKMFYFRLGNNNFIPGNFAYTKMDSNNIGDYTHTSEYDINCDPDRALFAGMDFGNMNSLVLSQKFGLEFRTVKNMHVLQPEYLEHLAKQFTDYYKNHKNKTLTIDYDRAGNNRLPNSNKSAIQFFKAKILEYDRDWKVFLRSVNMGNVPHKDRRILVNNLLGGVIENSPRLTIDEVNCRELKSSLQLAKVKEGTDDEKCKKNEKKRNLEFLPMYSTNYSDAYDYTVWGNFQHLVGKASNAVSSGGGKISFN